MQARWEMLLLWIMIHASLLEGKNMIKLAAFTDVINH